MSSYVIGTNISSMNAYAQSSINSKALSSSLEKLASGQKINKAADNGSGMVIADSLRSQANAIGQAIDNANDGIGIIQIADKAMEQQVKILDTIKTKATQAAQDGQSTETRRAIQSDIRQLVEELDNIAGNTSYNGKQLLSGTFTNKEFQVGAFSKTTIQASIAATSSDKIGHVRVETTGAEQISAAGNSTLTFTGNNIPGGSMTLESVEIDSKSGTGIGVLADTINKNSDVLGVRASYKVETVGSSAIEAGDIEDLTINGISIGTVSDVKTNDGDGKLVAAINAWKDDTGVVASVDNGKLRLTSVDGRAIELSGTNLDDVAHVGDTNFNGGRLTLVPLGAIDIKVEDAGGGALETALTTNTKEASINLRGIIAGFSQDEADAMGAYAHTNSLGDGLTAGVTTLDGAMTVMDIADSSMKQLDSIRSSLGSVQSQLETSVDNLSTAQVNIKSSESTIRDVDFAQESSNFSKLNILAQSGTYALSQSNIAQQNVLRLLQ